MSQAVLKIMDFFYIKERGTIVSVQLLTPNEVIQIGDIIYDLSGTGYKVIGLTHLKNYVQGTKSDCYLDIVLHINWDEKDKIQGEFLFGAFKVGFLFCNHPLEPKSIDADYEKEYGTASENFPCFLYSYEQLTQNRKLVLIGERKENCFILIYRGWMLKPEEYKLLYETLVEQNFYLINSPKQYNNCHLLPNWYPKLKDKTAYSIWNEDTSQEIVEDMLKQFDNGVIVKDYVKSRKHEWYDACYIPDAKRTEQATKIIYNFVERQGSALVGGIVLREFLNLKRLGYHKKSGLPISEEYRAFYFLGKLLTITTYWKTDDRNILEEEEIKEIEVLKKNINSNFFTIDFARTADGALVIMEVGDGQVCSLQNLEEAIFYKKINERLL